MKNLSKVQIQILKALQASDNLSLASLTNILTFTNAEILQNIKELQEMGVPIVEENNNFYTIAKNIELINPDKLSMLLSLRDHEYKIDYFSSIDSTNSFLKTAHAAPKDHICIAEMQTKGRGRFGRHWESPFGSNIYFSVKKEMNRAHLQGLSILVGVTILNALEKFCQLPDIKIKWPNDILYGGRKLAGILVEIVHSKKKDSANVIFGIGINVNQINKNYSSLEEILNAHIDKEMLIAEILIILAKNLQEFKANKLQSFQKLLAKHDYLQGKEVTIDDGMKKLSGKVTGINDSGLLQVVDADKVLHLICSGNATILKK